MKPSSIPLAACIDIGGSKALLGLIDRQGRVLARERFTVATEYQPDELASLLAERMRALVESSGLDWAQVCGLGYSTTGMMDVERGLIYASPNQGHWQNIPFKAMLEDSFRLPVRIEMDANAAALGEAWLGAGRDADPFVLVIVGTGIGAGILTGGKVLRGWRGTAGEIGHMCIDPSGPPCNCGGRGCLESLAAGPAIVRLAGEALSSGRKSILADSQRSGTLTVEQIFEAARRDDPLAREIVAATTESLAIGLTNLIHLINPQVIALGGGVGLGGADLLLKPLCASISKRVGPWVDPAGINVISAKMGNDAGILGAAWFVWNVLMKEPGK